MTKIGLISDTHGFLDEQVYKYFAGCDQIWHAGDFGNIQVAETLIQQTGLPLKGVFGNIDGQDVRSVYPEELVLDCEQVKVLMMHIGGYPPKYNKRSIQLITKHQPRLFITGHSHILKIMFDDKHNCLHINPGAAGKQGWHKMRTMVRFTIDGTNIRDCEVIELGKRG